jgi:ferrochelatase
LAASAARETASVGVLLVQLGTPAAPTPAALRTYLAEFLSDRRVIDLSRAVWWPILHGIVLRTRPARSAALYAKIWTPEGSPLAVITAEQAQAVQARLGPDGVVVRAAMRYGEPSMASVMTAMFDVGVDRLVVLPMYPQYAGATTGSSLERACVIAAQRRVVPALRFVPPFPEDQGYIEALAATAREHLAGRDLDHVVLSFHGLPERYAREGDPYPRHCERTAALLVQAMGWDPSTVTLAYQSRFGREPWLQPYTDETLRALARSGRRRIAVMCPGFTADCLETLEEMAITNREVFLAAGGLEYVYVPCLNASPPWLEALTSIVRRELAGWI